MDCSSFKVPARVSVSEVQATAAEVACRLKEHGRLGLYLAIVKRIGPGAALRLLAEVESDGARNPAALFLWKSSRQHV